VIDLIHIFDSLVDTSGHIKIPGVNDSVLPLSDEEAATYEPINFDVDQYRQEIGVKRLSKDGKAKVLQHRWRFPSLSIHGIQGAWDGPGAKTVIPHKITGKFSIRLVPNQEPGEIERLVKEHIAKVQAESGSPNQAVYDKQLKKCHCCSVIGHLFSVSMILGGKPWLSDFNHPHYVAGRNAVKTGICLCSSIPR
jgi:nonspecific dipeptidase